MIYFRETSSVFELATNFGDTNNFISWVQNMRFSFLWEQKVWYMLFCCLKLAVEPLFNSDVVFRG